MISAPAHAVILRRVALAAVSDARAAWKLARSEPTEQRVRGAFRACVLAARTLRRAAKVLPSEAGRMLAEAVRVEASAEEMKARLVRIVEG